MSRARPLARLVPLIVSLALGAAVQVSCGRAEGPELARPHADPATARQLPLGAVVGSVSEDGAHVWRGIPFAAPPAGALRWRAPQPPAPWSGTREALDDPSPCPQFATFAGGPGGVEPGEPYGSEDCLALDVFAPPFAPDAIPAGDTALPVMVWIHGGGNSIGDASVYDGSFLAVTRDVILVAVQYRLGPLGWFRHESLREDASAEEASGNFGTLDLVAALAWVQRNISAFGGDPGNVTVFGESAGGTDTYTMLLSPLARGLFHRAIVESGGLSFRAPAEGEDPARDRDHTQNTSSEVVARLRESGAVDADEDLAAALRALPAATILQAYVGERGLGMIDMPEVFSDGVVLPAGDPKEALGDGRYNPVPVILGTNRDEVKLFQIFDPALVRSVMGIPLWVRDWNRYDRQAEYGTRWWKLGGVDEPARRMTAAQVAPVYAYRFDWDEQPSRLWLDFSRLLGAAHAFEIPFVFGTFDLGPLTAFGFDESNAPGRLRLSDQMTSYWTEFARTGDPGRGRDGTLPLWTPWDESRPTADRFMIFDTAADGGLRMSADAVTRGGILDQIAQDPRFDGPEERCELLEIARQRRTRLSETDLRRAGCHSS